MHCFKAMRDELNPQVLLLLLTAVGLAALPHLGHISPVLSLFFYALLLWRLLGVWRPHYLPNGRVIFLLMILGAVLLYSRHQGEWGREFGTSVFVVALGLKLLELNRKRDVYLVSYLAFIVIASQFLFQQHIAMAAWCLLICCLLLAGLAAINGGQTRNKAALRTAAMLMIQALPVAAVIFVLFPRVNAPAWLLSMHDRNKAMSGLNETLEPGSLNQLALSPKLAFRVKFNGEPPPKNQLYWRGPVFSLIDGKAWRITQNDYLVNVQDKPVFSGKAYQYTLLLEPQNSNWVYALDMPAQFDASLHRNANYQLIGQTKSGEAAEFSLVSYPQYNTGLITKVEYRENRQLPHAPSARVIELVRQLHGLDDAPERFIQSLLAYFSRQHFSYSLQPSLTEKSPDPVETFLFETRSGYCDHYATAFVYLMRVADIPARVVRGYQGGELNAAGQFLEVRQANAHAWAEVWLEGKGWVRVDPTTAIVPERVERDINVERQVATGTVSLMAIAADQQNRQSGMKRVRQFWNSLDYQWRRWVISYGRGNQSRLLATVGIDNLVDAAIWLAASVGVIMLLLAGWTLKIKNKPEDPAVVLYRQFCRKMAKAGVAIRLGEGPSDFAARAKTQKPELGSIIDEISQIFVRLRYQRNASAQDLAMLKKRIGFL
jgi:transglutaminase-like putative cysteine protease